jgi:hypothetical protein
MPKDAVNAEVLVLWCNTIREQMKIDYEKEAEKKEEQRRKRIDAKKKEEAVEEPGAAREQEFPDRNSPTEALSEQVLVSEDLWEQYGALLGKVERVKAQLRTMGENI